MKTIILFRILLVCMVTFPLFAQDGKSCISGRVTDQNGIALESVTLLVLCATDSSFIEGGITRADGQFTFSGLKSQEYRLEFSMLGFRKQHILVKLSENQNKNIGTIILEDDALMLAGVTVTGKRTSMKMESGTTIFHMDAMILGAQGNVLDALRSLPGVVMNEDGIVFLNGQSGINVLINGKSTYLSGNQLVNYLRSMPVSSIKDVELITSPSAKYDASGKIGLINIQTQKVSTEGWTINANIGYQQNHDGRWNTGGRFTRKKNKVSLFADFSHSDGEYTSTLDIFRKYRMPNSAEESIRQSYQKSHLKDHNRSNWVRIGMDYEINDKFTFGISSIGDFFSKQIPGHTDAYFNLLGKPVDSCLYTRSNSKNRHQAISGGTYLNFSDRKKTADLSFDYLLHSHKETVSMHSQMRTPTNDILNYDTMRGDLNGEIRMYSVQANTTIPFASKIILRAGAKFTWVDMINCAFYQNIHSGGWQTNYDLSNSYIYNENINAIYVQANTPIGAFNLEGGLRLEQSRIDGTYFPSNIALSDSSYKDNYLHLFPTLTIQYNFQKTENSLSILYNRRIIRPNYRDLSPFNYIWDNYTRSTGNPNLRAELTDNIELAYIHQKRYRTTIFFSFTQDPIMQNIKISNDNVAITYPDNFKNNLRIGLRLEAGDLLRLKWWRMTANATLLYSLYKWEEFDKTIDKRLFTPSVSLNNQFILPAKFIAELSGFYNGRMAFGQATINPHYSVSIAIQKKVWNDKFTLRLYANDIFQSNRQDLNMDLAENRGRVSTLQFNDYRCVGISISFNLNQGLIPKKNSRDTTIDESKRINL